MTTYKSDPARIQASAADVFATLSDMGNLRRLLDNVPSDRIPEESRRMLDNIKVTGDSITVAGGPTGSITLRLTDRKAPDFIRFEGVGMPVKLNLDIRITPETAAESTAVVEIDADIPMMLRPMVGGALQKAANQMAVQLARIPFARLNSTPED